MGKPKKMIEQCFESLGYTVSPSVLWASDYGVPQHRNRFFLIGNANGIKFEFPPKHEKQISVEEAIGDLPILGNGDSLIVCHIEFHLKRQAAMLNKCVNAQQMQPKILFPRITTL